MEIEKIRNLSDAELVVEVNKTSEQLFRLRFQLNLGQTDVVKKIRILRKDVAKIKTVERERELDLHGAQHQLKSVAAPPEPVAETEKQAAPKKTAARKVAGPKKAAAKKAAKTRKTETNEEAR
ncbi:MAG TPA: 50S ribosomal protein L29 [Acidobacteriaceae bacterium]|nr:50S ribosomal protein L29 [Acidobacteriaceae bacterium]